MGLVSMPTPQTTPKTRAGPTRLKSSVARSATRPSATIAASGRSSCNRSEENTTNGAVAKSRAAAAPIGPPTTVRPSRYTAAMPRPRKAIITRPPAVSIGMVSEAAPTRHKTSGG